MYLNKEFICVSLMFTSIQYSLQWSIPKVLDVSHGESSPLAGVEGKNNLKLECKFSGDPEPTISWSFNGTMIEDRGQYRFSSKNSRLNVFDVTLSNAGIYRCYAENPYGTVFGETFIPVATLGAFAAGSKSEDGPKNVKATLGKNLTIPCPKHSEGQGQIYFWGVVEPKSPPKIWQSGSPLPHVFVGEHGSLTFAFLQQNDVTRIQTLKGISCILYNEKEWHQSIRFKIEVDKVSNETFGTQLVSYMDDEFIAIEGETENILCGATGRPQPQVTWYKDGVKIYDADSASNEVIGDTFELYGGSMQIRIRPVKREDSGVYKCVAKNPLGEDIKEGRLIVHYAPSFTVQLLEKSNFNYHTLMKLTCIADGFPAVKYTWYHNNTIIKSNAERVIEDGLLTIAKPTFNHSGIYMCVASNKIKTVVSPGHVTVDPVVPSFGTMLENPTYFFKKETSSIYCNATGGPAPAKQWYRNDKKIVTEGHFTLHDNSTVTIVNASETDGGQFKCVAINVKGVKESVSTVKVVERTVITKPPAVRKTVEGYKLIQLFCDAVYETKLHVSFDWLKNGVALAFDGRIYKEKRNNGLPRIIFFRNLKMSDAANYTCRVSTRDGPRIVSEDQKVGAIVIIAKPKKPTNTKFIGNCDSMENVTLTWTESVTFGTPVKHYIVEYASAESQEKWHKYNPDENPSSNTTRELEKKHLPASADLIFRVTAVAMYKNERLVSQPSKATSSGLCVSPQGPPMLNPNNVRSQIEGDGKLTVTWDPLEKIHKPGPDFEIIVGYRKVTDPPSEFTNATVPGGQTSFVVPNPGSNEKYEVFVQSKNKFGVGPASKIEVLTSGDKAISIAVENVQVVSTTSTDVVLSWDEVIGATGYRIFYKIDDQNKRRRRRRDLTGKDVPEMYHKDVTTNNGGNVTGLQPNKKYKVTVAALNANGPGPESQPIMFKTNIGVPDMPTNVKLDVYGSSIRLLWTPPSNENGEVTSYKVRWYKSGNPNPLKHSMDLDGNAREAFITDNIDPMAYYTVELVAITDAGEGKPWVMEGVVVGQPDSLGKPGKPIVNAVNASILNVTFMLPSDYVGNLPEAFVVYYREKDGNQPVKEEEQAYPTQSWLLLYKLDPIKYVIWTVGKNSLGVSDPSDEVEGTPTKLKPTEGAKPIGKESDRPFYTLPWFIILIVLLILLIIFLLICFCCLRRGGKYPVGEKEKDRGGWGHQPLNDYADLPMDEVNGDAITNHKEPIRSASQNSIQKIPLGDDDDNDSLDDYGEDTKFNEDGSFIGQYGGEDDKKPLKV